ncbi:MAG TPA: FAD-binding protein [Firmicutes bacterium]|nr:FAD-binding protein [Bacillota bacterium]
MKNFRNLLCLMVVSAITLFGCNGNDTTSSGADSANNQFEAGVYTGVGSGNNGEVKVSVEFSETEILSVTIVEHRETEDLIGPVIERIPGAIVNNQSLAIDAVAGATNASNAVLDAVADAVTQAGGDAEALKVKDENDGNTVAEVEEITTDVVVVGGGASGSAAALAATEAGANVVLLEKAPGVSGAGTKAGVLFASNSSLQVEAGKEVDKEWLFDQYMEASLFSANARLVRNIIEESSETVDWLIENGVNLNLLDSGHGAQFSHVGMPTTAHGYADGGTVAITTLHEEIVQNGGTVMYETPGEELIFDESGKVSGVVAKTVDGKILHIKADSVVLSTGGFGGNDEMMEEYFGEKAGNGLIGTSTGDGLEMAWSAGAAEKGTNVAQFFGMSYETEAKNKMENSSELTEFVRHPLLFVNNTGKRFTNEEVAYESVAIATALYEQPDGEGYIIFNQSIVDEVALKSLATVFDDRWGHLYGQGVSYVESGHLKDLDQSAEENRTPKDFSPVIEDAVNAGVAFKANSIEELAQMLGMDYLVDEVANYNEMCAEGEDTQFFKDSKYLNNLEEGPFFAVKIKTRVLSTLGGVAIDENIQAINANGEPIENLWVTGADAGGLYGSNYVVFEGGTLGFAYTSGRIAGLNAATNAQAK